MSMNAWFILHVILTLIVTTQLDRSAVNVILDTKETEPIAEVRHYIAKDMHKTITTHIFPGGSL